MGLDWCIQPTDGKTPPLEYLGCERYDPNNPDHISHAEEVIQVHAFQQSEADEAARVEHWKKPFKELEQKHFTGKILPHTVSDKYRHLIPALDNPFAVMGGVEMFRGKRVAYCGLLPEDVRNDAYRDRDAEEMEQYADVLDEYVPMDCPFDYEAMKKKADALSFLGNDDTIPDEYWDYATLLEARDWLQGWAEHPVKMNAWY